MGAAQSTPPTASPNTATPPPNAQPTVLGVPVPSAAPAAPAAPAAVATKPNTIWYVAGGLIFIWILCVIMVLLWKRKSHRKVV